MLIQYHVWFSFKPEADVSAELIKVRACLDGYLQRGMLAGYRMFEKRPGLSNDFLPPFHVAIEFTNDAQFAAPFSDVRTTGIHQGLHGVMIENVAQMVVETFEELPREIRTE